MMFASTEFFSSRTLEHSMNRIQTKNAKIFWQKYRNGCIEASNVQAGFGKHAACTLEDRLSPEELVMLGYREEESLRSLGR